MTELRPKRNDGRLFSFRLRGAPNWRHCGRDCYLQRVGNCHCICGGLNHGVGRQQAINNSKQIIDALLQQLPYTAFWICDDVKQLSFDYHVRQEAAFQNSKTGEEGGEGF